MPQSSASEGHFMPIGNLSISHSLIAVDGQNRPFRVLLDEPGIVIDLRLITGELLITVRGNPGICSHSPFGDGRDRVF